MKRERERQADRQIDSARYVEKEKESACANLEIVCTRTVHKFVAGYFREPCSNPARGYRPAYT